ncbi:hypothetical protein PG994_002922 [Apiospora phragmitis]|uniref:Uncharacterized protein n=1 Tax=Apiospora phragmitis TaxID=2905665 RepID=A0ABR1W9G5_9PEZI
MAPHCSKIFWASSMVTSPPIRVTGGKKGREPCRDVIRVACRTLIAVNYVDSSEVPAGHTSSSANNAPPASSPRPETVLRAPGLSRVKRGTGQVGPCVALVSESGPESDQAVPQRGAGAVVLLDEGTLVEGREKEGTPVGMVLGEGAPGTGVAVDKASSCARLLCSYVARRPKTRRSLRRERAAGSGTRPELAGWKGVPACEAAELLPGRVPGRVPSSSAPLGTRAPA